MSWGALIIIIFCLLLLLLQLLLVIWNKESRRGLPLGIEFWKEVRYSSLAEIDG